METQCGSTLCTKTLETPYGSTLWTNTQTGLKSGTTKGAKNRTKVKPNSRARFCAKRKGTYGRVPFRFAQNLAWELGSNLGPILKTRLRPPKFQQSRNHQETSTKKASQSGVHINHAFLFERKGFEGEALTQMQRFADKCNLVHKVLQMRPKWGLDFSIDYVDAQGNVFEVLHWEWDSFSYEEIKEKKDKMDQFLVSVDWQQSALKILDRKDEWHHLGFFEQSEWKTNFFGVEKEQFKMVLWN